MSIPTLDEVLELKKDWESDPIWDIEDTEGFEYYRQHLLEFRKNREAAWASEAKLKIINKAMELGTDNLMMAEYILKIEARIEKLEGGK